MIPSVLVLSIVAFVTVSSAIPGIAAPPETPAETGDFSSERPGFTNGTETIPQGHFQLETGLTYNRQQGATGRLLNDGAQFRYGLSERSEVRLGLPSYGLYSADGARTSGWASSSLSGKVRFLDESASHPSLALIVATTLPTGSPDTSEHYFQPLVDVELSRQLTERITVQTNFSASGARDSGTLFRQYAGALNVGMQVTPEASVFMEVYRITPTGAGGAANGDYFDAGVTLVRQNRWQFDINGGIGLLRDVRHDYFLTTGVSRRW